MSDRVGTLFRRRVDDVLARRPEIRPAWSEDRVELTLPRRRDDGFDVLVEIGNDEVIVHAGGAHEHLDAAVEFVEALLSPDTRVRELRSGQSAYRWFVEARRGDAWHVVCENGLLFYNYFGKRSQRIYRNGS
jgi:hypothetical protein